MELCLCCPSAHFLIGSSSRGPGRQLWALVDGAGREGGVGSTTREEFSELPPQNEGIAPIAWGAFHNLLQSVQSPLLPRRGRDGGHCSASKQLLIRPALSSVSRYGRATNGPGAPVKLFFDPKGATHQSPLAGEGESCPSCFRKNGETVLKLSQLQAAQIGWSPHRANPMQTDRDPSQSPPWGVEITATAQLPSLGRGFPEPLATRPSLIKKEKKKTKSFENNNKSK